MLTETDENGESCVSNTKSFYVFGSVFHDERITFSHVPCMFTSLLMEELFEVAPLVPVVKPV